ncbi:hypothetical protein BaRGS_00006437 [Batillaria attramentaria]|uniref:Uncharacterized protein n=1 Tax=Batillaria attramentaria TaxID=370345 RepID=A0ABD0LSF3_9CAEN
MGRRSYTTVPWSLQLWTADTPVYRPAFVHHGPLVPTVVDGRYACVWAGVRTPRSPGPYSCGRPIRLCMGRRSYTTVPWSLQLWTADTPVTGRVTDVSGTPG